MRLAWLQSCLAVLIAISGLCLGHNHRISGQKARLEARQQDGRIAGDGVRTLKTVRTFELATGTRTETCDIILTPVKSSTGEDVLREDRTCTSKFTPRVAAGRASRSTGRRSSTQSRPTSTSLAAALKTSTRDAGSVVTVVATVVDVETATVTRALSPSITSPVTSSVPSALPTPNPALQPAVVSPAVLSSPSPSSSLVASPSLAPPVSVIGLTFVAASSAPTSSQVPTSVNSLSPSSFSATPTSSVVVVVDNRDGPAAAGQSGANAVQAGSAASASGSNSASGPNPAVNAAAANTGTGTALAAASATAIQLPGTKMQVLPIGLGIFGGITLIALLVVAYVMWERTRYRRMFRANTRKLTLAMSQPQMQENSLGLGLDRTETRRDYGGVGRRI